MAKKSLIEKWKRKPKFKVRAYNRCRRCGRPRALPARFRPVPHLLPRAGARRADPGRRQVELVGTSRNRTADRAARERGRVERGGFSVSVSDPVADFLTCVRNADPRAAPQGGRPGVAPQGRRSRRSCCARSTSTTSSCIEDSKQGILRIYLKYTADERRVITGIKRISTPGRRVYVRKTDIPRVLGGLGTTILSTSQGHHVRQGGPRGRPRRRAPLRRSGRGAPCRESARSSSTIPARRDASTVAGSDGQGQGPKGELAMHARCPGIDAHARRRAASRS